MKPLLSITVLSGLLAFVLMAGCGEVPGPKTVHEVSAEPARTLNNTGYSHEDQEIEGMKFRIFYARGRYNCGAALAVINLTKEKLEVQLLKSQQHVEDVLRK